MNSTARGKKHVEKQRKVKRSRYFGPYLTDEEKALVKAFAKKIIAARECEG